MSRYSLHKFSPTMYRVHLGRSPIGWARAEGTSWAATANGVTGQGATAAAAFHHLVRQLNDQAARADGFADEAAAVAAHNAGVLKMVADLNSLSQELGMGPVARVRRRRR